MIVEVNSENISSFQHRIASVHFASYSIVHFTSCFSIGKLEKYYRYLVEASDLSFVVIDDNNEVLGFLISGEKVSDGVERFIKEERKYLWSVFFKHPRFMLEKFNSLLKSKLYKSTVGDFHVPYRLMSISVKPDEQSKGVGKILIDHLEASLCSNMIPVYGLSVRKNNDRAIKFYDKCGFKLHKETKDSLYFYKELKND